MPGKALPSAAGVNRRQILEGKQGRTSWEQILRAASAICLSPIFFLPRMTAEHVMRTLALQSSMRPGRGDGQVWITQGQSFASFGPCLAHVSRGGRQEERQGGGGGGGCVIHRSQRCLGR